MYALIGRTTNEILSYRGRMVLHDNPHELRFLFPEERIAGLTGNTVEETAQHYGRPAMMLRDHPDMAAVQWPIDPRRFL